MPSMTFAAPRTRLLAMLRRLGYNYDGKAHWTEAHMRYLRDLTLPDAANNRVLEDNITTIDFHHKRIANLEEVMLQLPQRLATQTPRRRPHGL
jgi:transposase